jgi:hypothetical protein
LTKLSGGARNKWTSSDGRSPRLPDGLRLRAAVYTARRRTP